MGAKTIRCVLRKCGRTIELDDRNLDFAAPAVRCPGCRETYTLRPCPSCGAPVRVSNPSAVPASGPVGCPECRCELTARTTKAGGSEFAALSWRTEAKSASAWNGLRSLSREGQLTLLTNELVFLVLGWMQFEAPLGQWFGAKPKVREIGRRLSEAGGIEALKAAWDTVERASEAAARDLRDVWWDSSIGDWIKYWESQGFSALPASLTDVSGRPRRVVG